MNKYLEFVDEAKVMKRSVGRLWGIWRVDNLW